MIGGALALPLAALLAWGALSPTPERADEALVAGALPEQGVGAAHASRWRDGGGAWRPPPLQGRYAMRYTQAMGPPNAAAQVRFELGGELVLAADGAGEIAAHVVGPKVRVEGEGALKLMGLPEQGPEAAFGHPMRISYARTGALKQARFTPETPQAARATFLSALSAAQLIAPAPEAEADTWRVEEHDGNIATTTTYTRSGDDEVRKVWQPPADARAVYTSAGEATFTLKRAERVEGLAWKATITLDPMLAGQPMMVSQATLTLERLGDPQDLGFVAAASRASATYDGQAHQGNPTRADMDAAMVKGRSFKALEQAITSAVAAQDWRRLGAARHDLSASMRLNPAQAKQVGARLRAGVESARESGALMTALVGASTPEALHEVATIAQDAALPMPLRASAVRASSFASPPSAELIAALQGLSKQPEDSRLSNSARMALGANLYTLGTHDADAQKPHLDALLADAEKALSTDQLAQEFGVEGGPRARRHIVRWLDALGNTRSPQALRFMIRASSARDPWIRASALYAMRHIHTPESAALLQRATTKDPNPDVRRRALQTLAWFDHDAGRASAEAAMTGDPMPFVRMEAAFTLTHWVTDHPELREVFRKATATEKDPKVRETLLNYATPNRQGAVRAPSATTSTP